MPKASSPPLHRYAAQAWAIVTLVIVVGTLAPFRFKRTPADWWWHFYKISDVVLNVVLFFPFGFCAMLALTQPRSRPARFCVAIAGAAVLSVALESTQRYLPDRMATVPDVIADVIGAMAGAYVASRYASAY